MMSERDRWLKVLLILLVVIAGLYLAEKAWQLLAVLSKAILLFLLALVVTFILYPLVEWLSEHPVPRPLINLLRVRRWERAAGILARLRLPHGFAVTVVYLGLLFIIMISGILLMPIALSQLTQLGAKLPDYMTRMPELEASIQESLSQFNIKVDLTSIYRPEEITARAEAIGSTLVQNALTIATQVASIVADVAIILALSFYMALDGPGLIRQSLQLLPASFYEEVLFTLQMIGRIFGGLIRGYIAVAILYGLGTAGVMLLSGLGFVLVISVVAGLVTAIPILGAPVAIALPVLITLFQKPNLTILVLLTLIIYQQILLHIILPKIISEAAKMPALLIITTMLMGFILIGFWGFIMGVPAAAVIYATALSLRERLTRRAVPLEILPDSLGLKPQVVAAPIASEESPEIRSDTEPFFLERNGVGCLLIHDFTGTPAEMREMGEYLAGQGFTVYGVRLAGHGTTPEDMEKTNWHDWYASVYRGLMELRQSCNQIFVMGLSLGGALALYLAAHHRIDGLVAMSTPITTADWRLKYMRFLKYATRFVVNGPSDFHDPTAALRHISYDRTPTRCAESLAQFLSRLDADLPLVRAPVLLIHSRRDALVPPSNMPYIYERISSTDKEMFWLENSGHVVTEDGERLLVFERAYQFVYQRSKVLVS